MATLSRSRRRVGMRFACFAEFLFFKLHIVYCVERVCHEALHSQVPGAISFLSASLKIHIFANNDRPI